MNPWLQALLGNLVAGTGFLILLAPFLWLDVAPGSLLHPLLVVGGAFFSIVGTGATVTAVHELVDESEVIAR